MAILNLLRNTLLQPVMLRARGLSTIIPKNTSFTPEQLRAEQVLGLTSASISLVAGCAACYWFVRMRRTFRHKLIMLLIQSDLNKAIWYWLFPVITFTHGPIASSSRLCQATGFFVSFFTEASDWAILMIAVHAALYVFQSDNASGEAGLYKYRYYAYTCWIIYPTLMASLAFINHNGAYQSWGTICALPVRPFWYRLALSWIPRYMIIFTIIALYIAIYLYVHYKFDVMDKQSGNSYKDPPTGSSKPPQTSENRDDKGLSMASKSAPSAPAVHSHYRLPSEILSEPPRKDSSEPPQQDLRTDIWENYSFGGLQPAPQTSSNINAMEHRPILTSEPSTESHASAPSTATDLETQRRASIISAAESGLAPRSNYYLIKALRDTRISSAAPHLQAASVLPDTTLSASKHIDGPNQPSQSAYHHVGNQSLRQRHAEIKRKLRLLFIYPIIYMLMWLIPFASHCLQYTDYYSQNPPYGLSVAVTIVLPLQGAADSLMFSIREKPWRYVGKGRLFPWGKPATTLRRPSGSLSLINPDSETGAVMDEEQAKAKNVKVTPKRPAGPQRDRSWWEIEGRMRMDSVMLGTDHNCVDHGGLGQGTEGRSRRPTIQEEEEPLTPPAESGHVDFFRPEPATVAARRGYGGLHAHERSVGSTGRDESGDDIGPV